MKYCKIEHEIGANDTGFGVLIPCMKNDMDKDYSIDKGSVGRVIKKEGKALAVALDYLPLPLLLPEKAIKEIPELEIKIMEMDEDEG